eukprot:Rhum_TRINITY_DN8846_c0_g1::Rhum_TRINITY_DN8846_c0_g1_i1::g.30082::m.30082
MAGEDGNQWQKVILLGDTGVGKSSLVRRYEGRAFSHKPQPTTLGAEATLDKFERGGQVVKLQLWDTDPSPPLFYRKARCVILCYDTTSRASFKNLKGWMEKVSLHGEANVPVVLVGTKSDLTKLREVPVQLAVEYAETHGMSLVETSAMVDSDVRDVLRDVVCDTMRGDVSTPNVPMKTIFLGDVDVGKTALVNRMRGDAMQRPPTRLCCDFFVDTFERGGKAVTLCLWDTAGQERFTSGLSRKHYHGAHCVVVCYDTTNQESFEHLTEWMEKVELHYEFVDPMPAFVLVGTKTDLTAQREVSQQTGAAFAEMHGMVHVETSAVDYPNVRHVLRNTICVALERRKEGLRVQREREEREEDEKAQPRSYFQRLRGFLGL